MKQTDLKTNLKQTFDLSTLSEEEQLVLANDVGELILESSLLRLMAELSEDQTSSLDHYLDSEPSSEELLEHLIEHYEVFPELVKEELQNFQKEALFIINKLKTENSQ